MSCKDDTQNYYAIHHKDSQEILQSRGKELMETKCYVCHATQATHNSRLAPPMMAVKRHYQRGGVSKEEFTERIWQWVQNPNAEEASMHGAVKRFGVMPKQEFSEEEIEQIAAYMYDNDLPHPSGGHH